MGPRTFPSSWVPGDTSRHIAICSTQTAAGGGNPAAGRAEPPDQRLPTRCEFSFPLSPCTEQDPSHLGSQSFPPHMPLAGSTSIPCSGFLTTRPALAAGSSLTFNYASCLRKPLARPSLCSPLHRNKLLIKPRAGIPRCLCALKLGPGLKIRSGYRGAVTGCGDAPPKSGHGAEALQPPGPG